MSKKSAAAVTELGEASRLCAGAAAALALTAIVLTALAGSVHLVALRQVNAACASCAEWPRVAKPLQECSSVAARGNAARFEAARARFSLQMTK